MIDRKERVSMQVKESVMENEVRLQSELADSKLLEQISAQLIEQENIEALYSTILNAAVKIMRSKSASMQSYHSGRGIRGELKLLASKGFTSDAFKHWKRVRSESPTTCGMALKTRTRVIAPDITQSEFMAGTKDLELHLKMGIRATQSTPLISRNGEIVGMISTHWVQPHKPSERDLRMFDILSRQAADLIENRNTQKALCISEKKLRSINETLEQRVAERTATLLAYQDQLRSLAFQLSKAKEDERHRLAVFLHDHLGQVLAVGKMELDLIKDEEMSEQMSECLNRLTGLLSDAIMHTRDLMSDLKPSPSVESCDLVANVQWIAEKMKKYGLEVTIGDDGLPKRITSDIQMPLCQSVRELLFNIVKHANVKQAEVSLVRINNNVHITIKDEGRGFNPEGEELYPGDLGGFGLFTLKERMAWLGSSLEIHSRPGEGTSIELVFPLDEAGDETHEPEQSRENILKPIDHSVKNTTRIKVLIADDHIMMRRGLRKMIEEEGDLDVIAEASNGAEAVELTRIYSPDVIIMDVNMPGMNGIEATRQIVNESALTRIIGLSFHEENDVAQAMMDAGASTFLSKSDVFETLCATVRSEGMILKNKSDLISG